jgi:hypothetical protein
MIVLDPGHAYLLHQLDGENGPAQRLQFVKREGEKYPGNVGACPGTTTQETIRALVDRTRYVDRQNPCEANRLVLSHLRSCLYLLEKRAAMKRCIDEHRFRVEVMGIEEIERLPTCCTCGHLWAAHAGQCS